MCGSMAAWGEYAQPANLGGNTFSLISFLGCNVDIGILGSNQIIMRKLVGGVMTTRLMNFFGLQAAYRRAGQSGIFGT